MNFQPLHFMQYAAKFLDSYGNDSIAFELLTALGARSPYLFFRLLNSNRNVATQTPTSPYHPFAPIFLEIIHPLNCLFVIRLIIDNI